MASKRISRLAVQLTQRAVTIAKPSTRFAFSHLSPPQQLSSLSPSPTSLRQASLTLGLLRPLQCRRAHSIPRPRPESAAGRPTSQSQSPSPRPERPHYELTFTCNPCGSRSRHNVSKQGYHHGSVLITCPSCRNRHVISDHLGIFSERKGYTVEDLMKEKGGLVRRGTLGEDGDVEFWEDGTVTAREKLSTADKRVDPGTADSVPPGTSFAGTPGQKSQQ